MLTTYKLLLSQEKLPLLTSLSPQTTHNIPNPYHLTISYTKPQQPT